MPRPMEILFSCSLISENLVHSPGGEDPSLHDNG